ncbi:coatomer protein [Mycena floridula]|nr:coatomer protein [Mycena floridula]
MLFEVNKKLFARSDRVKSLDFHPSQPWVLTGLYNGTVTIHNTATSALVSTFEVSDVPVRCVRFIPRKNWFVAGSDDFQLRVYNYNTHDKVASFEAHPDYIRCLEVHPTMSIVITGSDDMTIKAWDWDKAWANIQTYEGHTHYIMNLTFNPKDPNTFASACLDRTVKIWSLGSATANFTLEPHDKGVNYVDFYPGADKPYIVTTSDDKTVKVWDYLSKSCVATMQGHTNNVSFAVFHPSLPVIISGSEDGTVKIWNAGTYRIENTLSYGLERAWSVALGRGNNEVGIGYDEGVVVIRLGKDEPAYSMDASGKAILTKNQSVLSVNLASQSLVPKEIGNTEIFATSLLHSPNGRWVTVVGDGEYIIYTALAWRNKSFGSGISFAWAPDSNTYAILETRSKLKVYKNFKERPLGVKGADGWILEGLHGGALLAGRGKGFVVFWDWESGEIVRRIDVDATNVHWSSTNNLVAITSSDSFYVLRFDRDAYDAALASGVDLGDEGVEEAFEVVSDVQEAVTTAKWIGDCFIYTTTTRLSYFIGTESYVVTPFDTPQFLLGYLPNQSLIYLVSATLAITSHTLPLSLVEYQLAVLRSDLETAASILPTVPEDQHNKIARFLESKDLKELALEVTRDPDHKFDLALQLDDLDIASSIVRSSPDGSKWKQLGDRALAVWRFDLARESFNEAGDLQALLLLLLATGDREGLEDLAVKAKTKGMNNLAFVSLWELGDAQGAVELLMSTGKGEQAAMFARTYAPNLMPKAVEAWQADLIAKGRPKIAASIAHPVTNPELFEATG